MKKKYFNLKKNIVQIILAAILFFVAGIVQIKAQNNEPPRKSSSTSIPPEFISATEFRVNKSVSPILVFDDSIPYFTQIEIVDGSTNLVQKIVISEVKDSEGNIIKKEFNFSDVPSGTYYAKGMLTGTLVYYRINLAD